MGHSILPILGKQKDGKHTKQKRPEAKQNKARYKNREGGKKKVKNMIWWYELLISLQV